MAPNISLNCSGSKVTHRLDPLVEQNRFRQSQSKPRLVFMRPTIKLTIDQHYIRKNSRKFELDAHLRK